MPPKEKKKGKDQKKKDAELAEPQIEEEEEIVVEEHKEIDFINDLDEDFFCEAFKIVQNLAEDNRMDIASKVKKYVTILGELHKKYVDEVEEKLILRPKLAEADEKLKFALKLTGDSQDAMSNLKLALENAWKDTDASRTREQSFQDQLKELLIKLEILDKKDHVDEQDDNAEFGHLAKHKHMILKERDRLHTEVVELQRRVEMQRTYIESLEKVWQNLEEINDKTNKKIESLETEKKNLEKRLRFGKDAYEELKEVNRNLNVKSTFQAKQLTEQAAAMADYNRENDRLKLLFDKAKNENTISVKNIAKLKDELAVIGSEKKALLEQFKNLKNEFKNKHDLTVSLQKKLKKSEADYDSQCSKNVKMDKQIHSLKEEILKFKNSTNNLEKSLIELAAKYDNMRRLKDFVTHERDNLRTDIAKLNNIINELKHENITKTNIIDDLQMDIKKNAIKLEEAKKAVGRIEKERDEQIQEVQLLQDKIINFQEQLQLKIEHVITLNEQLVLKQAAFLKIQKLLETTNSERLILQRSLQSCCEERANLKALLSKATHQITQLTEEISANQNKINSLNLQIDHLRIEKQEVETELRTTKATLKNTRQELKEMNLKNETLQKTISEDEIRFLKLSVQLDNVRKEKNLIGLQMVRRNDEIILLKEKLAIFQDALDRGQVQYNQRIEDIRLLKLEISNLQTQRDVLTKSVKSTADMREEIVRLQCLLDQEKIQNSFLIEDLKTPVNVHRWRILSGSDPERFALTEKVQVLQKQVLRQQIQGIKKDKDLKESHQLYVSVKTYMEKLPTYKLKKDFVRNQHHLRNKEKKLKALSAELTTKELDVKTRDCEVKDLKTSLVLLKKDLFRERKLTSKLKNRTFPLDEMINPDCDCVSEFSTRIV